LKALQEQRPKEVKFEVLQFFETQWEEYLGAIQLEKKGPFFHHKPSAPIVFMNDVVYIGDSETFLDWALNEFRYVDQTSAIINKKRASDAYRALIDNTPGRNYAFFDVNVGGDVQKVVIELFTEFAPKTCDNFLKICKGETSNAGGEKLTYVGTEFHHLLYEFFFSFARLLNEVSPHAVGDECGDGRDVYFPLVVFFIELQYHTPYIVAVYQLNVAMVLFVYMNVEVVFVQTLTRFAHAYLHQVFE
jgi:hypothetical protein